MFSPAVWGAELLLFAFFSLFSVSLLWCIYLSGHSPGVQVNRMSSVLCNITLSFSPTGFDFELNPSTTSLSSLIKNLHIFVHKFPLSLSDAFRHWELFPGAKSILFIVMWIFCSYQILHFYFLFNKYLWHSAQQRVLACQNTNLWWEQCAINGFMDQNCVNV